MNERPTMPRAARLARPAGQLLAGLLLLQSGCKSAPDPASRPEHLAGGAALSAGPKPASLAKPQRAPSSSAAAAATGAPRAAPAAVDTAAYPWLADRTSRPQTFTTTLAAKIAPPAGFQRVEVAAGSFGQWLRGLPLRPGGAVVDYKGREILPEGDPRFAAIVALDEGTADLQQCADSIVRLHAEWQWSKGHRAISYRAASGAAMPLSRWLGGERPRADGNVLRWSASAKPADRDDHGAFRKYLDAVFTWANTGALARDAAKTSFDELRPGDFFVLAGAPGHAVLVLDVATNGSGERAVLLGQGYMPAQSFHVLRPAPGEVWFSLDRAEGGVQTPFWPAPFPWSSLRRLD